MPTLTGRAVFSGSTPPDPVKGHYMSLAAFGAKAFHLHFGIVTFIIEFEIIKFFRESMRGHPIGIRRVTR